MMKSICEYAVPVVNGESRVFACMIYEVESDEVHCVICVARRQEKPVGYKIRGASTEIGDRKGGLEFVLPFCSYRFVTVEVIFKSDRPKHCVLYL